MRPSHAESDISSFRPGQPGLAETINYADSFSTCTTRVANYTCPQPNYETTMGNGIVNKYPSCASQLNILTGAMSYNQLHCYPDISYLSGLQFVNSVWGACLDSSDGGCFAEIFDPWTRPCSDKRIQRALLQP